MDIGATISRAINITLKHRVLWVLGFLAALAGSGTSSNVNFNVPGSNMGTTGSTGGELPPEMAQFFDMLQQNSGAILAGAFGLICVLTLISIALWVVSIIARGGLIGGVDQIEREGNTTFGQAWRMGAAKFWRLLGLNLLLALPLIVAGLIVAVLIGGSVVALIATAAGADGQMDDAAAVGLFSGGLAVFCIGGAFACVAVLYSILVSAITTFGERAIVLDNAGVMDSIRKGWDVFRNNLGNIILIAVLMFIINFVIGLVVGLVSVALFAPVLISSAVTLGNEGTLGAGTVILGALAFIAVIIISAIISALFVAFNSTTWTLAYRQFTGRGIISSGNTPAAPLPTAR
jgi:hypothetical protein